MLLIIWLSSLLLAGSAILSMLLLIFCRVIRTKFDDLRAIRRDVLLSKILDWLHSTQSEYTISTARQDLKVSSLLFLELLEVLRGPYHDRLVMACERVGIADQQQTMLGKGFPAQRREAAENLVWFASPQTVNALLHALDDPKGIVRIAAAGSLASLKEHVPLEKILHHAQISTDHSRLLEVVFARIATAQRDELVAVLENEAAPVEVRSAVVGALASTGNLLLVEPIGRYWTDNSPAIRGAVARALGVLGHPNCANILGKLLKDTSWEVRAQAAQATGDLGLVEHTPQLLKMIIDENWWVRFTAGAAIARLGDAGLIELQRIARQGDVWHSRAAELVVLERHYYP